jgi:hypothetical protein
MRRAAILVILSLFWLLPGAALAKAFTVVGTISKPYAKQLGVRHTANLLGHKRFTLTLIKSGKDQLVTDHFKATAKTGASFKPFAVHVQRAKIEPKVIAPAGTSRVSFGSLKGWLR